MKSSATKLLAHLSFWLATLVMCVMGWTLHTAAGHEIASAQRVSHVQEVLRAVAETNELISRAESAQRGFLLTAGPAFLTDRELALASLEKTIARVKSLTADNESQRLRMPELEGLIAARIAILKANMRVTPADSPANVSVPGPAMPSGQQASASIFALTAQMRSEELARLKVYRQDAADRHATELWVLVAGLIFGALVLLPGYIGFVLQSRARMRTERKLRVMADSLPGAMYQLCHPTRGIAIFTFISSDMVNLCGTQTESAGGAPPDWTMTVQAIDARDRPGFVQALQHALATLTPFHRDYRVLHRDGTRHWLRHEASLILESDGSVLQNGYIADITGQRAVEDALHEAKAAADSANRAKSNFLATMSHEIRTPLNGALGMLELLSLTPLDAEQQGTLTIVRESSMSLLRIIDDILDFSRIEADKLELRPEVVSIRQTIVDLHNIYQGNASSKGLLIRHFIDPAIHDAVVVDPLRLRQILNNFVSNALKFTVRGTIDIRADLLAGEGAGNRIRFSVKDTGVGISPADQQLLFQPFAQAGDTASRRPGGTGLGLTICRRLADLMGGTVDLVSEPGSGTTLFLTMDLKAADAGVLAPAPSESGRDWLSSTTSMRRAAPGTAQAQAEHTLVLVVDDHPINLLVLSRQVRALGYAQESATNGLEALAKWKSGRFSLIITDCNMPEMDGYDLTRSIRRLELENGGGHIPVIAFTANALGGVAEECLDAGMDDVLVKPVELSQILKKLDKWLPIPAAAASAEGSAMGRVTPHAPATPLDSSALAAFTGGDPALEFDTLRSYRRANQEDAATLKRALADADLLLVTHASHRMLGASRIVGARSFADVCERIGIASRAGDWPAIHAEMRDFEQEWSRLDDWLGALA